MARISWKRTRKRGMLHFVLPETCRTMSSESTSLERREPPFPGQFQPSTSARYSASLFVAWQSPPRPNRFRPLGTLEDTRGEPRPGFRGGAVDVQDTVGQGGSAFDVDQAAAVRAGGDRLALKHLVHHLMRMFMKQPGRWCGDRHERVLVPPVPDEQVLGQKAPVHASTAAFRWTSLAWRISPNSPSFVRTLLSYPEFFPRKPSRGLRLPAAS